MDIHDEKIACALQSALKKFDRIVLIIDRQNSGLCYEFCNSNAVKKSKYKILVLSTIKYMTGCYLTYYQITKKTCDALYKLYHLYEFSDRFQILSREISYGGLFNFNDVGIIDREDIFTALLH